MRLKLERRHRQFMVSKRLLIEKGVRFSWKLAREFGCGTRQDELKRIRAIEAAALPPKKEIKWELEARKDHWRQVYMTEIAERSDDEWSYQDTVKWVFENLPLMTKKTSSGFSEVDMEKVKESGCTPGAVGLLTWAASEPGKFYSDIAKQVLKPKSSDEVAAASEATKYRDNPEQLLWLQNELKEMMQ